MPAATVAGVSGRHLARPAGQGVAGGVAQPVPGRGQRRQDLLEADNLDEAIEVASRMPAARLGGLVEGRPSVER